MPRTVVLGGATYRDYGYGWAVGMFDSLRPNADVAARLAALDVVLEPGLARGYSGGRQTGTIFAQAADLGAEFVLTCEADMSWRGEHVAAILEAHAALCEAFGSPNIAVGATYPASSKAGQFVLALDDVCGESCGPICLHETVADVIDRLPTAADGQREPFRQSRYAEAVVLPCGFTLWPLAPFRGVEIVERMSGSTFHGFDKAASEHLRSVGGRLFVDLALDVGHMVAVPMTAAEMARKRGGT